MIKLIIKNPNGSIETKILSEDSSFTPKAGQQFYFDNSDGSRKYTFNLTNGESSIELMFAGNGERLKFNLNGMADLIKQSDLVANENKKTVLGIMNDEDGLKELNQTALNNNFQGDKVISELKELLDDTNNPDEKYQNGIIIDDFGALAEQLDAAAAGPGATRQNAGTSDDVIPTSINTYSADGMGVGTTFDRADPSINLLAPNTGETPITVYAEILGTQTIIEGETAEYTVRLIDINGNEVIVSVDTVVYIAYKNITTQDGDTEYNDGDIIEVIIKAGNSSAVFEVDTIDDIFSDSGENYNLTIISIDSNEFDDLDYSGEVLPNTVTTTIVDEEVGDKVLVQLLGNDTVIEADGAELTHTIKLVDENGNAVELPIGKTITLTLTYTPDPVNGTEAEDFTPDSLQTTVTITGTGSSEYTITNTVVDDALLEGIESYTVTLVAVSDDDNVFEDLSVDSNEYDAIGSIADENVPFTPEASVDFVVDPDVEELKGTANTPTVDVVITDEAGNVVATFNDVSVDVNGQWDLSEDPAFQALVDAGTFKADEDYTATVTAEDPSDPSNTTTASDTDDYPSDENAPTVNVDLEVDPGLEVLEGSSSNADTIEVVITDENGVELFRTTVTPDVNGNWEVPVDQLPAFEEGVDYTATATATNTTTGETAVDSDTDDYSGLDLAYKLELFAVITDENGDVTYAKANTITEELDPTATYVVLAVDSSGEPLAASEQPNAGEITVTVADETTDSDANGDSLDYDSVKTITATVGTPFTIDAIDDAFADSGETFTLTLGDDWTEAVKYEKVVYDQEVVRTTINDEDINPEANDDRNYVTETGSENIAAEDIYDTIAGHDDGKLTATGDVMSNDSGNVNITITQVVFASVVYTLPTDGSNLVIDTPLGQLSINNTGVYTYIVDDNAIDGWDETDSQDEVFTYTLSDGANPDDTANLTITVEGRDDAPIIQNITTADVNLNNDASIKYTLDVDGDGVTDTLSQSALLAQDRGLIFEEDNGNLQIDLGEGGRDVAIEYHGGNASYKNIFGYYELDANGNPTNFVILYADAGDEDGDGSNFDKNMNIDLGVLQDLEGEIGFFIIPDGNSNSSIASAVSDILTNPNTTWTISTDDTNHIVLTNGSTTITTADTYYTDNNLSTDGRDHAIAGISEDGTGITIGFEDLPENSTDQDYDDFVFTIKYCDTTGDNGQLFTNVNFTDVDDANLTSATVTLTDAQAGDTLSVNLTDLPSGINAVINGNTITFTNVASLDDYEDAIEAIRFETTSSDRSTREFEIEISDGIKTDSITKTVNIIGCEIETYSPVYIKIVEADSVTEGDVDNTLTHKVILVDAAGNAVTVPDGESVTITLNYTDGTGLTDDDFTTARQVTVTINGGESEAQVTNYVKNDLTPEGTESYTVEIASIDNNPFDTDLINTETSTTGTIIDNDVSVTVDLEVDPGAEKLEGTSENATSIELVIKDENGVEVFRTTVTPDANGNWSVPVSQLPDFDEEIDYTVTATAKDNVGNEAEATDTDMYDLKPTITVESASVDEDFITNLGNFTNPDGDTAQNTSTDNGKIETNATEVVFADNQTTLLTSDGNTITLTTSDDGKSITGTANGETIFTAVINDAGTSYDFTLSGNIDHPYGDNIETVETLELTIVASDANGNNTLTTLEVEIGDDVPCANDADVSVDADTTPINLIFTLDISGSMGDIVDGTGKTKLQIAVEAMKDLVDGYESQGKTVNVQLTTFSTEATDSTVWMNSSTFATVLAALKANGWTNYEDALQTTVSNYENSTVPTGTTYAYFLSDGAPTVEMNDKTSDLNDVTSGNTQDGIDGSFVDTAYVNEWNQFVSDNNIAEVYAVGIGNYVSETYLEKITTSDNVIIVKKDDLVNLSATLQETIVTEDGILTYCCGADGFESFTWGTDIVATDVNGDEVVVVWTLVGTTLTGTINGETVIKLEATDVGTDSVKYVISEVDENSGIEDIKVPYIITDGDGDSVTAYLNIDIVVPVDDIPTISVIDPVIVDEDALPAINTTDTDGYDNVYFEIKSFTYDFGDDGVGSIQFTSGQATSITSNGQDITLVYSDNNQTITGVSEDGTSIFTISLDVASSQYTFTLLENVDHPVQNAEDLLVGLSFEVEIVDGNGSRAYDVIDVEIADDIACANDANISVDVMNTTPVNLIFTLDISGSMGGTKLQDAINAIKDLVSEYEAQGREVYTQLNVFTDTASTPLSGWMDSSTLDTVLDSLSAQTATNYEAALEQTIDNYTVPTNGGAVYIYFLSDGVPTVEQIGDTDNVTSVYHNDGVDDNDGTPYLDSARLDAWNDFINDPANNISEVYSVGIEMEDSSYLELISDNAVIVDSSSLSSTLVNTVVYETGALDFCFGADGAADGTGTKLDGDKLPFTWEVDNLPTSIEWTLSDDGTILTGTINNETVIKVEATDIYTDSPKYVITQLSENIGVDNLSLEYTVTDGDGDSVTAELNVDINIPVVYERDVITCEDTSYTFTLNDFDSSAASIRIDTLPVNGVLYLAGNEVHIGDIISSSDITAGNLTFKPDLNESGRDEYNSDGTGNQQNDYAEFNFSVSDGTSWISVNSTMTIDVSPVADAPILSVLGIVGESTTIDVTNVTDTSGGYSVSAYKWNSATNEYEIATISEVSGTLHDGFGVLGGTQSGTASGDATEIGFDVATGKSEMIAIKFDNEIGSVDISYAWKHSYDNNVGLNPGETAVVEFYKNGVLIETQTHYDSTQTDTIDGPYTFALSGGESFDEIRIYAQGEGDDFLIHDVTFTEIETSTTQVNVETGNTFDFEISSSLFDTDGSESLVSIVIDDIPEGMILTDGTNTFTSTSSNDSVDVLSWDLDAIKITVPNDLSAGDYDLSITAKSQESLNGVIDSTCPLVAETSTTFKIIVSEIVDPTPSSVSESQDMDVCLTDTNLVITLDVSGSMTNDNGWIDTNGDGHGDTTRLQLAKDAIIEMINKYSVSGTVMVQLTLFDSNAQTTSWMTATDAIAYISAINAGYKDTVDYNQMTDYETAINSTVNNYTALNNGAQTIAYFISDGSPTEEIDDGYKEESGYLDSQYITKWTDFINSIDGVHAVGIGSGVTNSTYLETMSVGTGAEYTDDLTIDSTLTNGIGGSVSGNLLDNIVWGVDSNGDADEGTLTSIIIDGVTYNAADYVDTYTFNTGQGEFEFNFATGEYTYTNTESDVNNDYSEVIYLKATDSTGDVTTYNLTINVDLGECTVSNPIPVSTSVILTDDEAVVDDGCHSSIITSVSTSYTVYDSDDIDLEKFVNDGARNIDSINLEGNSTSDILNVDLKDVIDLTDSDNQLKIFGDSDDKVVLDSNSTWTNEGTQTIDGDTFNVYRGTDGASNIKILIDTDVSVDPDL